MTSKIDQIKKKENFSTKLHSRKNFTKNKATSNNKSMEVIFPNCYYSTIKTIFRLKKQMMIEVLSLLFIYIKSEYNTMQVSAYVDRTHVRYDLNVSTQCNSIKINERWEQQLTDVQDIHDIEARVGCWVYCTVSIGTPERCILLNQCQSTKETSGKKAVLARYL